MKRYVFITLEWVIYIYIHHGSPYMDVTMSLQQPLTDKLIYRAFRHYVVLAQWCTTNSNIRNDIGLLNN